MSSLRGKLPTIAACAVILCAGLCAWAMLPGGNRPETGAPAPVYALGGVLCPLAHHFGDALVSATTAKEEDDSLWRFIRPSCEAPYPLPYTYKGLTASGALPVFTEARHVVEAYFALVADAANVQGTSAGCGSIGMGLLPYPYAYSLLTPDAQLAQSEEEFIASFYPIGRITLLKLREAYTPPNTPEDIGYFFVEVESIAGMSVEAPPALRGTTPFVYHMGLITTQYIEDRGWLIKHIAYTPEDFLCAPYHGWDFDARASVAIIYQDYFHLIDKIDTVQRKGDTITVTASSPFEDYRFVFVRLANGYDLLLEEYQKQQGEWVSVNLAVAPFDTFKFSPLNPELRGP